MDIILKAVHLPSHTKFNSSPTWSMPDLLMLTTVPYGDKVWSILRINEAIFGWVITSRPHKEMELGNICISKMLY